MLRYSSKGNMSSLPYILFLTKFCSLFFVSLSSFSYFLFLHFSYPFIGHCFLYFIFPYSSKCFLPLFSLPFFPFASTVGLSQFLHFSVFLLLLSVSSIIFLYSSSPDLSLPSLFLPSIPVLLFTLLSFSNL